MSEGLMANAEQKPVSLFEAKRPLHKEFAKQIACVDLQSEKTSLIQAALFMTELDALMDDLLTMNADNQTLNWGKINADLQDTRHIPNSARQAMLAYIERFWEENEKTQQFGQQHSVRDLYQTITYGKRLTTTVDQSVFGTALLWEFHSGFTLKSFFQSTYKGQAVDSKKVEGTISNYTVDGQKIRIIAIPKGAEGISAHEKNHEKYNLFINPVDKSLDLDERLANGMIKTADELITEIYSYWLEGLKFEVVARFAEGLASSVHMRLPGQPDPHHVKTYLLDLTPQVESYNYPKGDQKETQQLFLKYFADSNITQFDTQYQKITDQYKEFRHRIVSLLCDLFKGYEQKEKESRNPYWERPYTVFVHPSSVKTVKTISSLFMLYPIEQWDELIERCQRSFSVYNAEKNIHFMPWELRLDTLG